MKYREIYDEYTSLLQNRTRTYLELSELPQGSIVKKHISGKEYHYLQYTVCGKKKTEYLRGSEISKIQAQLERSKVLKQELDRIGIEMERIEKAVKILDQTLSKNLFYLRQCADMDAMPISKRHNALLFAASMTALEGLPVRNETEQSLMAWARGECSFADFYIPTLQHYHVMEGAYEVH